MFPIFYELSTGFFRIFCVYYLQVVLILLFSDMKSFYLVWNPFIVLANGQNFQDYIVDSNPIVNIRLNGNKVKTLLMLLMT